MDPRPGSFLLLETARPASEGVARPPVGTGSDRAVSHPGKRHRLRNLVPVRLFAGDLPRPARQPLRSPPTDGARPETPQHLRLHRRLLGGRRHGRSGNDHARSITTLPRLGEAEPLPQPPRSRRPPFLQGRHLPLAPPLRETGPHFRRHRSRSADVFARRKGQGLPSGGEFRRARRPRRRPPDTGWLAAVFDELPPARPQ